VQITAEAADALDALHRTLRRSRRQIASEAIIGHAVLLDLSQTVPARKEDRPWNALDGRSTRPASGSSRSARLSGRSSRGRANDQP
jgi:hypothetical protein